MPTTTSVLSLLQGLAVASAYSNGIDPRDVYEEMEHIMVDNFGTNNDGFVDAVTPCSNYVGFATNITIRGEQTSAQWTRIVFHDFVTANISAGTGYDELIRNSCEPFLLGTDCAAVALMRRLGLRVIELRMLVCLSMILYNL